MEKQVVFIALFLLSLQAQHLILQHVTVLQMQYGKHLGQQPILFRHVIASVEIMEGIMSVYHVLDLQIQMKIQTA
jgi:hypothetical protein